MRHLLRDDRTGALAAAEGLMATFGKRNVYVEINRHHGFTILLVEQNANLALEISTSAFVLETGQIVMAGPSKQLHADPRLKATYLGG